MYNPILPSKTNIFIPKVKIWHLQSKALTSGIKYWCQASNIWCSALNIWQIVSKSDVFQNLMPKFKFWLQICVPPLVINMAWGSQYRDFAFYSAVETCPFNLYPACKWILFTSNGKVQLQEISHSNAVRWKLKYTII